MAISRVFLEILHFLYEGLEKTSGEKDHIRRCGLLHVMHKHEQKRHLEQVSFL